MPNLMTMIALFEQKYPNMEWLMRQDAERGYFVHLHSPKLGFSESDGYTFPAYAPTVERAFGEAFGAVEAFFQN